MGPRYATSELLSMRGKGKSVEQLVLGKLSSERGIREHVLRCISVDSTRTVAHPQRSSSIATNQHEGFEPPPNDDFFLRGAGKASLRSGRGSRFSPTPSIRRGKVAALLRAHASPPGVRVTAGGRLVPDGTSPITSPRSEQFGKYDRFPQVPHLAPSQVPNHNSLRLLDGMIVNIGGSEIAQIVNGQLLHVGYTNTTLNLHLPPTNPVIPTTPAPFNQEMLSYMPQSTMPLLPSAFGATGGTASVTPTSPESAEKAIEANERKFSELKGQLRQLDREEVLQRQYITPVGREDVVRRRMALQEQINEVHQTIKQLRSPAEQHAGPPPQRSSSHYGPALPYTQPMSVVPASQINGTQVSPFYIANGHTFGGDPSHALSPQAWYPSWTASPPEYMGDMMTTPHSDHAAYGFHSARSQHPTGNELQERAGNVGLGIASNNTDARRKTSSQLQESSGMNLDGSVVQPRRSHAVEIKRPEDPVTAGKNKLNPASPSFDPSLPFKASPPDSGTHEVSTDAKPHEVPLRTPKRLTKTDPGPMAGSTDRGSFECGSVNGHGHAEDSFKTSSTANTNDFYPNNPHDHSSRNWTGPSAQDSVASLAGWVGGDVRGYGQQTTPIRSASNNYLDQTQSPCNASFKTAANGSGRSSLRVSPPKMAGFGDHLDVSAKPRPLELLSTTARDSFGPAVPKSAQTSFDSDYHCDNLVEQNHTRSTPHKRSPTKTDLYWDGFKTGLEHGLCARVEEDYTRGYRDGLLRVANQKPLSARRESSSQQRLSENTEHTLVTSLAGLSRQTSAPSFQPPRVPSNTAVNTPLRRSGEDPAQPNKASVTFDTALLGSHREGPLSSPAGSSAYRQGSYSRLRFGEPISPLSERNARSRPREPTSAGKLNIASSRVFSETAYDQQRFARKATASIAPTFQQAQQYVSHQLDGSAEDEIKPSTARDLPPSPSKGSPVKSPKGKDRGSASSSPIKRTASSAVHKLTQLSGIAKRTAPTGGDMASDEQGSQPVEPKPKKEDDPAKMSAPERARWRSKWRKRLEDLKRDEQRDIDDYKRANP